MHQYVSIFVMSAAASIKCDQADDQQFQWMMSCQANFYAAPITRSPVRTMLNITTRSPQND